jgi:hypothetical protein
MSSEKEPEPAMMDMANAREAEMEGVVTCRDREAICVTAEAIVGSFDMS